MFDSTSRYYNLETVKMTVTASHGQPRALAYKRRRFLPPADGAATLVEHAVTEGDRLDNVTALYLNDPTQFWRVCDANNVLGPEELEEVGRVIRIALPLG